MPVIALSRRQVVLVAVVLVALLAVAGKRLAATGAAEVEVPAGSAPAELAPLAASPAARPPLVVHVVGAVLRPGLYRLRDGARVADAVSRAGGAVRAADLSALNLAAPLADGAQVLVPRRQPGGQAAATAATGPGPPLSLATASVEQLDELPGVGPVTAQKIVDYRTANGPFGSVDELDEIPGIGPARIEQIRDLVTP